MNRMMLKLVRFFETTPRHVSCVNKPVSLGIGARLLGHDSKAAPLTDSEELIYPEAPSKEHSDLATFLAYAERSGLSKSSSVYRGTHYEYTVAEALSRYGFFLKRVGGASDYGTDLLGTWTIPTTSAAMRVVVQCKAGKQSSGPQYVRELQGALGEAPPGWRGPGVVGLLVSERAATKGVRETLRKVSRPMGYALCSKAGEVQQLLWNAAAEREGGLKGISIGVKHDAGTMEARLVLTKEGRALPFLGDRTAEGGKAEARD